MKPENNTDKAVPLIITALLLSVAADKEKVIGLEVLKAYKETLKVENDY